jgi:hypothetical protein
MDGANRRDPILSEYASAPPGSLFVNHQRWSAYVAKMLTDEQSVAYTKMTEDRHATPAARKSHGRGHDARHHRPARGSS